MLKVTNFKISLKVEPICLDSVSEIAKQFNIKFKRYNNFIVVHEQYTYIIFKSGKSLNNHINVTKIKLFEDIKNSQQLLFSKILKHLNSNIISYKIDNITASYNLNRKINIDTIIEIFKNLCEVRYNNETFPGVFLKHIHGTIIIFHSGKTILIGSKDLSKLKCLTHFLIANI